MRKIVNQPVDFDGRTSYDSDVRAEFGFEYSGIGRDIRNGSLVKQPAARECV
jgi:hypothetical protein